MFPVWPLLSLIISPNLKDPNTEMTWTIWHFDRKGCFFKFYLSPECRGTDTVTVRCYIILQSNSIKHLVIYHTLYINFHTAINPLQRLWLIWLFSCKQKKGHREKDREVKRKKEGDGYKDCRENISVLTDLSMHMPPVIALTQQLQPWPSIIWPILPAPP